MRFQSVTSFNKLAPQLIADAYGPQPGGLVQVNAATGTNVILQPAPPAGQYLEIQLITAWAPTTATSTAANITIRDASGNFIILISYAQANGIMLNIPCRIFATFGFALYNASGVQATAMMLSRTIPIPD